MGPLDWDDCPSALPGTSWADSGRCKPSCWATLGEKPCPPELCWCCSLPTGPADTFVNNSVKTRVGRKHAALRKILSPMMDHAHLT